LFEEASFALTELANFSLCPALRLQLIIVVLGSSIVIFCQSIT